MHGYKPENPLIVQSDKTVLLEVDNDQYADARDALARFAELEKSPEYVHTYRISPLSLWNAAAAGLSAQRILGDLERYSKYPLPDNIRIDIADSISRYGRLKIVLHNGQMLVASDDHALMRNSRATNYFRRLSWRGQTRSPSKLTPPSAGMSSAFWCRLVSRPRIWPATWTARPCPSISPG